MADGMVIEPKPTKIPSRPSDAYIQTLRDIGAPEETIRLAVGEKPKRHRTVADIAARLICWAAIGIVATLLVLAVIHA